MKNSDLIIPLSIIIHLGIINYTLALLIPEVYFSAFSILYFNIAWLVLTYSLNFYPTKRKERFYDNIWVLIKLYFFYALVYLAPFGFMDDLVFIWHYHLFVYIILCAFLILYRIIFFKLRRTYRFAGGNFVNVVVIGWDKNLKKIRKVFDDPYLGYRYNGFFADRPSESGTYLGNIDSCFGYILNNNIDEIYCVASELSPDQLKNLIHFADNNLLVFKVIPDNKNIYSRAMSIDLYDKVPVISLRRVPLDTEYGRVLKRIFDVVFSLLVIILVLTWLIPILFVIVKLDSKGPLLFKQKRHGYKRKVFWCYKFRSMTVNKDANLRMAAKNDARLTRVGKILRKTNLDEMPQFFNVFKGDMSVVGPRPHMELHTKNFETSVDKYLVRHFVKPGITGLAQIKGYRGEIVKASDIHNRTRLDIFYVEKWSIFLDIRIVFLTILNTVIGEEKAY
ncbi:exopolysaccharide biosynthesis polyprenyl glycosylphosphotransferase [Ulvibacterium marinum]|uniref:exopolysaccharide biosynthesis polyprenyl glycosylphosphotransferase n=1 Tax=Ulvibacterium marinum TaxID=2419782 RepID=UPI0024941317|nr:exopolysaccharide biosynthesis polyprenyl glycosylphosphotransferase [Ulvibacterium marinum]